MNGMHGGWSKYERLQHVVMYPHCHLAGGCFNQNFLFSPPEVPMDIGDHFAIAMRSAIRRVFIPSKTVREENYKMMMKKGDIVRYAEK
jgi:hypothetical protein